MALKANAPRIKTISTSRIAAPPKRVDQVYQTPEWRGLIARIIAKRGRKCEECGRVNCRIFGDHTVELKDGGELLDERNVRLLCGSCHGWKTIAARDARMARPVG